MSYTPGRNAEVVHVALPEDKARSVQPAIALPPFLKVTVPAGVPLSLVTAAVKVTDGGGEEKKWTDALKVVAVAALCALTAFVASDAAS
jgi:hypothetical protein